MAAVVHNVGVDWGENRGMMDLLLTNKRVPRRLPGIESRVTRASNVELPSNSGQPVGLQLIKFSDLKSRYVCPRAVLEGVIIQELAREEQRDGAHSVKMCQSLMLGSRRTVIHSMRQIVQRQDHSGGRQTS